MTHDARRTTDDARWTTDAGQKAITITHLEQSSGELKNRIKIEKNIFRYEQYFPFLHNVFESCFSTGVKSCIYYGKNEETEISVIHAAILYTNMDIYLSCTK